MSTLWKEIKETFIDLCHTVGLAWWVEIKTSNPNCTYYFGPFLKYSEAQATEGGYMEDLKQEGAQIISVRSKRCKPPKITLSEDAEHLEPQVQVAFTTQLWNAFRRKQILQ
jgi:Domain of unknown function (DUF1816)